MDLPEPILASLIPPLTEVEAEYKCMMFGPNHSRWGYDGGVFDCVAYYITEDPFFVRIKQQFWILPLLALLSSKLFLGGRFILNYAEKLALYSIAIK